MVIRATALTSTDISNIESIYGQDFDSMILALETQSVDSSVNDEDLLAYVLEMVGSSDIDPDNAAFSYLWQDSDVQDMLNNFHNLNSNDVNLNLLLDDLQAYMAVSGADTGLLNEAAEIIQSFAEEFGTVGHSNSKASEFKELIALMKQINPGLYLILYVMYELGPKATEGIEEALDKRDEISEELADKIDELGGLSSDDLEDSPQLAQEMNFLIQGDQNIIRSLDEIISTLLEVVQQAIETGSENQARQRRGYSAILNNM